MKLTSSQVCEKIGIKIYTLYNWYRWYKLAKEENNVPDNCPGLPEYFQEFPRYPRYWEEEDIEKIKEFQAWIPKGRKGVMGNISIAYWGKRGKKMLEKRKEDNNVNK